MGQTEIYIFIFLASFIVGVFIVGIILFIIQYRRRVVEYEQEKQLTEMLHQAEIQQAQLEMQAFTMQDIGRELHDGIGQRITLASIYHRQLCSEFREDALKERHTEVANILKDTLAELRNISKELTSDSMYDIDLQELLQHEIDTISRSGGVHVESQLDNLPALPFRHAKFVVRIFQEFVQNSLKYADCKTIRCRLFKQNETVILELSDDGKGFHIHEARSGIGLNNMQRRAELIGAVIQIQSQPGEGTSLHLELPLNT